MSHLQPITSAMHQWSPPDTVFDWDEVMIHVRMGAVQDAFDRYCGWHHKLKRQADEPPMD